jgi:hypothetical protein
LYVEAATFADHSGRKGQERGHDRRWEWTLHEGHDFGRRNNVEGHLLYVAGEQTSSVRFRLDQLSVADELMGTLMLRFEETKDGIAKVAWATANGLDVELFHIVANI